MNINFQALGCRLNEAEIESWADEFMRQGHQVTTASDEADVVVFNSCAVTAQADRKSRQQIGRLHRIQHRRYSFTFGVLAVQPEYTGDQRRHGRYSASRSTHFPSAAGFCAAS